MKQTILTALLSAVVLSTVPVLAQPAAAADKGGQAKPTAPSTAEFDKQMAKAQENMKKMQEQMNKVRQTQDPQARQKLLQEHWTTMQGNMQMMEGMWGPGGGMWDCMDGSDRGQGMMMGGPMMGWGDMSGHYSKLTPAQMKQRQYMMDRYMRMQQMMMDQMMQQQQYMPR